jgi:hypothetical protein
METDMAEKKLTTNAGAPVVDSQNVMTAGRRGPALLQDVWYLEKLAHFDREVIPERRMHAKGSGAYGTFTVTHDITRYNKAAIFSEVCLMQALRRLGLAGTQMAKAQCQTIRVKLLKIGARIRVTVLEVWVSMAGGCPYAEVFGQAFRNLKEVERSG